MVFQQLDSKLYDCLLVYMHAQEWLTFSCACCERECLAETALVASGVLPLGHCPPSLWHQHHCLMLQAQHSVGAYPYAGLIYVQAAGTTQRTVTMLCHMRFQSNRMAYRLV